LTADRWIPDDVYQETVNRFEASTPVAAFQDLIQQLKMIRLTDEASWKEIIKSLVDFQKIVKDLA
jgi:hypothetical protein